MIERGQVVAVEAARELPAESCPKRLWIVGRMAVLAVVVCGVATSLAAASIAGAAPGSESPTAGATATVPVLSSSLPPKSAVQTGAGKVQVVGPVTAGAKLLRLLEDGAVVAEARVSGTGTKAFDRRAVAAGTHTYALQSGNTAGWATASSTVSVVVVAVPVAPGTLTLAQRTDTGLTASFERVANASSYVVSVNGVKRAAVTPRAGTGPLALKVDRLALGVTYTVTLSAANLAGSGPSSAPAVLTLLAQMKKVSAPTTSDGARQTGAGAARIVAKLTSGAATYALVVDGAATGAPPSLGSTIVTFDVTSLAAGVHQFAVRATNARYTVTSRALALEILPVPSSASTVRVVQTSDTAVTVNFTPGAHSTASKVYLDGVLVREVAVSRAGTVAPVALSSLVALSTHAVEVVSVNVVGAASGSGALPFTLFPTLPATVGLPVAVQTGANAVRVTIATTTNATAYVLTSDGVPGPEAVAASGSVVFNVTGVTVGGPYTFAVVAKNPRGSAPPSRSATLRVYPEITAPPDVDATTRFDPGDVAAVDVSFTRIADVDGYRIYVDGVLTTTRPATIAFVAGRATVALAMSSTVGHTVEVSGYNVVGEGPRSDTAVIEAAP